MKVTSLLKVRTGTKLYKTVPREKIVAQVLRVFKEDVQR